MRDSDQIYQIEGWADHLSGAQAECRHRMFAIR